MPPASKARHSKQLAINALHILKVDHLAEIRLLEHIETLHVIIDPNIFRVKTSQHYSHHNSSNINLLKMQTFSHEFQSRKTFWGAPSWRRDFWPCLPLWGPGPSFPLASTAAPFESRNSAAATWPLSAAKCSGVWPQALSRGRRPLWLRADDSAETEAPRRRRKLWECWALYPFNRQRNDECFGPNIFETVQSRKLSQTHRTSFKAFKYNMTFNRTFCKITRHSKQLAVLHYDHWSQHRIPQFSTFLGGNS